MTTDSDEPEVDPRSADAKPSANVFDILTGFKVLKSDSSDCKLTGARRRCSGNKHDNRASTPAGFDP